MILIEGIKNEEASNLTTIWTQIRFPNTSIPLSVWLRGGKNLPKVLTAKGSENYPLNKMALNLKHKCYPISRSAGYKYLKISELINSDKIGIIQQLEIAEEKIFILTEKNRNKWCENNSDKNQIQEYCNCLDENTSITYQRIP